MEFILRKIMLQPNCGLTKKQQMLLRFASNFHWSFPRTSVKLLSIVHLVTCDIVSWLCKQAPVPAFHIRIWRSNVPPPDASTFRCQGHQDTAYKIEQKKNYIQMKAIKNITFLLCVTPLFPIRHYMFKVNNWNTKARCGICSKLTIKTPVRGQWRRSGVFIVNFEHISHLVLVFLLLTLSK